MKSLFNNKYNKFKLRMGEKKIGFRQKLVSLVKKVDNFGTPVGLTYK